MGTREDFLSPEQLRVDRFGDYFTYLTYYSQELQHSLDTQIFILALRHYSSLITSTSRNLQEIILQTIFCVIGPEMAAAAPPLSQLKVEQTRLESFHEN